MKIAEFPGQEFDRTSEVEGVICPAGNRTWRESMARPRNHRKSPKSHNGINLRLLKKELKLIPNDIKREMRFLDLLFAERNFVRTQAEREVLKDFIDTARGMVEFHQNRLERYQKCYDQLKARKAFDHGLLLPDELHALQDGPPCVEEPGYAADLERLRTGTDG